VAVTANFQGGPFGGQTLRADGDGFDHAIRQLRNWFFAYNGEIGSEFQCSLPEGERPSEPAQNKHFYRVTRKHVEGAELVLTLAYHRSEPHSP
jgi:hypothetical protein